MHRYVLPVLLLFRLRVITASGFASLLQHNMPHSLTELIYSGNHFSYISKSLGVKPVILLTLGYSIPVTSPSSEKIDFRVTLYDKQLYTEASSQLEPLHHWRQHRAHGINACYHMVPLLTALQKELLLASQSPAIWPLHSSKEQTLYMDFWDSPSAGKADAF